MEKVKIVIPGRPFTKKNSSRIVRMGKAMRILPSKQFMQYQEDCAAVLKDFSHLHINQPINMQCHYYMPTRQRADLVGLLQASDDILTHYGVIDDDNYKIVAAHDGSRVYYDHDYPRVEITIEPFEVITASVYMINDLATTSVITTDNRVISELDSLASQTDDVELVDREDYVFTYRVPSSWVKIKRLKR